MTDFEHEKLADLRNKIKRQRQDLQSAKNKVQAKIVEVAKARQKMHQAELELIKLRGHRLRLIESLNLSVIDYFNRRPQKLPYCWLDE